MFGDPIVEDFFESVDYAIDQDRDLDYSVWRDWSDGWFAVKGPVCNFFVGEAHDSDRNRWLTFGAIVRETELSGSPGNAGWTETYRYHVVETGRKRLSDTPLEEASRGQNAWDFFESLHDQVLENLGEGDLLYDGWVIWR